MVVSCIKNVIVISCDKIIPYKLFIEEKKDEQESIEKTMKACVKAASKDLPFWQEASKWKVKLQQEGALQH